MIIIIFLSCIFQWSGEIWVSEKCVVSFFICMFQLRKDQRKAENFLYVPEYIEKMLGSDVGVYFPLQKVLLITLELFLEA